MRKTEKVVECGDRLAVSANRSSQTAYSNFINSNISFLKSVESRLKSRVPSASSEAEQLVRHFSGTNRIDFFTGQKTVSSRTRKLLETALKSRIDGKPLSYILKETEFLGLKFFVSPETLIPRPETEVLAEEAIKTIDGIVLSAPAYLPEILDLGTGCGCLAVGLTMLRPNCRMTALDISSKALKIAHKNINFYCLSKKVHLIKSDLFSSFDTKNRKFWDLIISNPPYVPSEDFVRLSKEVLSEPRVALNGGPKGLSIIHRILDEAPDFMKENGWLLMEIGDGQSKSLAEKVSKEKKLSNLRFVKDLNGIERVLIAQKWTS